MTGVRLIDADEIARHLTIEGLIAPMRDAFIALCRGEAETPLAVLHPTDTSDIHVKSATLKGWPIFTVKMAGWSETLVRDGRPASSGMVIVFDSATCLPLAIVRDDHLISDYRTAAAGALVADLLARKDATRALVIGTGEQARLQAEALCSVRAITDLRIWGRAQAKSAWLAEQLGRNHPQAEVSVSADLEADVRRADVIVLATSARQPVLRGEWLSQGQHITSVGSDDGTKRELDPACLARADLIAVDAREAAGRFGNLRAGPGMPAFERMPVVEIGCLLARSSTGRTSADDLTVASLVGLGVQDLAAVRTISHALGLLPTRSQ